MNRNWPSWETSSKKERRETVVVERKRVLNEGDVGEDTGLADEDVEKLLVDTDELHMRLFR